MGDVVPTRDFTVRAVGETVVRVDQTCMTAIGGRRASRVVAEWAKRFGLTEAEFQVLWRLRHAPANGFDQTALSSALAFSPAQISASVERLRAQGHICVSGAIGDRRRHLWQLSVSGGELLDQMLVAATLDCNGSGESSSSHSGNGGREVAA